MRNHRPRPILAFALLALLLLAVPLSAAERAAPEPEPPTPASLRVTLDPARLQVDAGGRAVATLVVANDGPRPLDVGLLIRGDDDRLSISWDGPGRLTLGPGERTIMRVHLASYHHASYRTTVVVDAHGTETARDAEPSRAHRASAFLAVAVEPPARLAPMPAPIEPLRSVEIREPACVPRGLLASWWFRPLRVPCAPRVVPVPPPMPVVRARDAPEVFEALRIEPVPRLEPMPVQLLMPPMPCLGAPLLDDETVLRHALRLGRIEGGRLVIELDAETRARFGTDGQQSPAPASPDHAEPRTTPG